MYDVVIKNGSVIDGTGEPMRLADIAINGDRIVKIGEVGSERGRTEIDAYGHYVMPGFIDISNRSDVYWRLFQDPGLESLLRQGITSIIGGNSGASLAPIYNEQMFRSTQKWTDVKGMNVSWQDMGEFLDVVQEKGLSIHFGTFVGHGTLRRGIVGDEMRSLTHKESTRLVTYMHEAMSQGALGVSLGLPYTHGQSATRDELVAVAEIVLAHNALLSVHLRDEDDALVGAVEEIIDVIRETGVRTHITHLKAVGQANWSQMQLALDQIDAAQVDGFSVTHDVYPYTVTGSVLYIFLPQWVTEGGRAMMLGRLGNPATRAHVVKELRASKMPFSEAIVSMAPHAAQMRGRSLRDIARERDVTVEELVVDLLLASEGRVIILMEALSEENVVRALESPYSLVTSNSPGYTLSESEDLAFVHPRSFGSFPRLLGRYVRERGILSWEMAVHKSTAKVAERLGIHERGILREGTIADIVVIDPQSVADIATIKEPRHYAEGVRYVLVAGRVAITRGDVGDTSLGTVLRKSARK